MSGLDALEAELAATDIAADPEAWAIAAYRVAVARSELAVHPDQLGDTLGLLDKAARILTEARAPIEHARILTAAASSHRALGASGRALQLFERAAALSAGRVTAREQAAALINVGLAKTEAGDCSGAIRALDEAVSLTADATDEETRRLLGAALINRAQARQAIGTDEAIASALDDYEQALATLDADSPQAGMAAHGKGAVVLEQCRRAWSSDRVDPATDPATDTARELAVDTAIQAFGQALAVLGAGTYPFQHGIARHSLAIAYEQRNGPGDLARGLDSAEASLAIFDPRLHPPHWRTASDTIARLTDALGGGSRIEHIAGLLAATSEAERTQILRDRLGRLVALPDARLRNELDALTDQLAGLELDGYRAVTRSLLAVLMELPDRLLEAACTSLCRAHRASGSTAELDQALDRVIHDLLFGPQRVRVRDLLEANGWVRP